tara:strand:- start:933 stop:1871 length:939 start_codon:yes stop_codon:yes gene_type:complete
MKVAVYLNYVGLGANLLHLSYCHQIAEKYGPVTLITLCKNLEQALNEDPKIKEIITLDQKNKTFFGIFKIANILKNKHFDKIFIYYPSYRTQFAAKLASIKEIYYYPVFEKKNLHLVKKAKFYTEKWLSINNAETETKIYIDNKKKILATQKLKKDHKNIVLGVGSSGATTKWNIKNYIDLAKKLNLKKKNYFHILCGPTESELASEIINSLGSENCNSLSSQSISEVVPIISQCDIYIGNDSFGHHVMSQSGKPCFIIMLDTPRAYTDYSVNQHKVLPKDLDADSIDHDSRVYPDDISVDHVLSKINKLSY